MGPKRSSNLLEPDEHASSAPLLVLLDLRLPKVDGPEVLRRLRACEHTRSLPVAVLISCEGEQGMIRDAEGHADLCIQKVVDFERFTEEVGRLGELLEGPGVSRENRHTARTPSAGE